MNDAAIVRAPLLCCFDFDGLLADTAEQWTRAFIDAGRAGGGRATRIDLTELHGASVEAAARGLSRQLGVTVEAADLLRALMDAFRIDPPATLPGVAPLIDALAGSTRLVVVTNGPHRLVQELLVALDLHRHFEFVISADSVPYPKPAPDVYSAACRGAGVAPADAVAFEDSPVGVRSARSAGLQVVGVSADAALDADLVVPSLEDPRVRIYLNLA